MIKIFRSLLVAVSCILCSSILAQPTDGKATKETKALYKNLQLLLKKGTLFGHQDDLAYGVNWKYKPGRSDVKEVTGHYPGIYGWELGRLEIDAPANLDGVPFDKMRSYIIKGYNSGAVITISWHLNNPLTGKSAWDVSPANTVPAILPGGEKNELYNSWLDKVAVFFNSLKTKNGTYVPVIFRPFHELNGSWFWWGGKNCTAAELVQLWKYTVGYLRDTKNIHHLLYAFNTDRFLNETEYLQRYPGNEWVDIMGFDIYQKGDVLPNEKFIAEMDRSLTILTTIAKEKRKIPALTEVGYSMVPDSTWWTAVFLKSIEKHSIAYVLAWRNAGRKSKDEVEYYVPFKGQQSAADFFKFSSNKKIYFGKRTRQLDLYQ
ncbi:MAG: beta-mannosidase [Chitinophagaceae bacterium]|nr:beta-mannosidase [Chitinophagaceae bacterium]